MLNNLNLVYFVMSIHWGHYYSFNLARKIPISISTNSIFMNNICAGCWERHFLEGARQKGMCMKNFGFHQWARLSLCAYMGQTLVVGCWTIRQQMMYEYVGEQSHKKERIWNRKRAKEIFKNNKSVQQVHPSHVILGHTVYTCRCRGVLKEFEVFETYFTV